jgi:hypothetical protein
VGLGLATGNLLLFAGYVESYTLDTLGMVWFLVACLLYLRGSAPPAIPACVLAVTLWLHPQTGFLLPALLAALLLKRESWAARARDAGVMLAAAGAVSVVVASIFLLEGYSWERWLVARNQFGGAGQVAFKPLLEVTGRYVYYPLISWAHLGGIIQEQLRLAPLALVVCVAALLRMRNDNGRRTEVRPASQSAFAGALLIVLAVAAVSTFIFSITWNPSLGASNDWDLLSLSGIPLSLLAAILLVFVWPREPAPGIRNPARRAFSVPYTATLAYCGSVLLAVEVLHALSWLLANALGSPY